MERKKIVVIGAGPAGIAAAVEVKEAGLAPAVVVEKAGHACDTIVRFYRDGKRVDADYQKVKVAQQGLLSFATESKEEFLAEMDSVINRHVLDIRYNQECHKIEVKNDTFHIHTAGGLSLEANIVVAAIGIFGKPVRPAYPIPKELRDKILFSLPKEPLDGKDVLVVGGGDSAAEAACFLCQKNRVTLSYRRPNFFRINEINMCTLNGCCCEGKVKTKMPSDIEGLEPEGKRIKVLFNNDTPLSFDVLFYFLGGSTPQVFLENAGVRFSGRKPQADECGETNIPRLFLAGDLVLDRGSIMGAFNSAYLVKNGILSRYRELVTV
ncbi:MAG: NAD(P)-binding domain-containing protein [Deltaproteobacteria bacterium]|nr:NAD(P)-binding domain-containing protein [Deltaproteobacteria bacterium]